MNPNAKITTQVDFGKETCNWCGCINYCFKSLVIVKADICIDCVKILAKAITDSEGEK